MEDVIDLSQYDEDDCVIQSVIFTKNNVEKIYNYEKIKQENLLFCEILEKCLNLENSTGMLSVINNKLVVFYNRLESTVKSSAELEEKLRKTLDSLNNDPRHKFKHIKLLCDVLSNLKPEKRRVKLITLEKNIKENRFSKLSCKRPKEDLGSNINDCNKKLKVNENKTDILGHNHTNSNVRKDIGIQEIDNLMDGRCNDMCDNRINFNNNSSINKITEPSLTSDVQIDEIEENKKFTEYSGKVDKENTVINVISNNEASAIENKQLICNKDHHLDNTTPPSIEVNGCNKKNLNKLKCDITQNGEDKLNSSQESNDENKLLVPVKTLEYNPGNDTSNTHRIKELENKIAICKRKIAKLDEQEVCSDSKHSPYMRSERLKAEIVLLYQELCHLKGEEPVKRRHVCIKAMAGHPPGPLKRLESFLNDNIGNDGDPPFPNFRDVVKCVFIANKEDNLGWSKGKIMSEARALFTYCGRALQKRRQKREYEDLLSRVDTCDDDPADHDPQLSAKLEANKQIAMKRELEVFQKFANMQNQPDKNKEVEEEDIYSDSETDESIDFNTIDNEQMENKDINMNEGKPPDSRTNELNPDSIDNIKIKEEPKDDTTGLRHFDEHITCSTDFEGSCYVIEISDSSDDES